MEVSRTTFPSPLGVQATSKCGTHSWTLSPGSCSSHVVIGGHDLLCRYHPQGACQILSCSAVRGREAKKNMAAKRLR